MCFYRFIDISDNTGVNRGSITILRIGEGRGSKCQSHVGRAHGAGEVQLLNLGYPCFYKVRKLMQIGDWLPEFKSNLIRIKLAESIRIAVINKLNVIISCSYFDSLES